MTTILVVTHWIFTLTLIALLGWVSNERNKLKAENERINQTLKEMHPMLKKIHQAVKHNIQALEEAEAKLRNYATKDKNGEE